ncbi:MAG TPA: PIN domain-containing protein [Candidatus Aquilonibacter sp.]|nr:PIN domain-containing protein [Candidatus Aquilonibacter sp.]
MRVALDTNFLAYAEGVNDGAKQKIAEHIIKQIPVDTTFVPLQVLGELFRVLVGKARRTPESARKSILSWQHSFPVIETSHSILLSAIDLAADKTFHIWDAVILASAASASCRLLLTEDMQEGSTWSGVTVVNPFAAKRHRLLEALIE